VFRGVGSGKCLPESSGVVLQGSCCQSSEGCHDLLDILVEVKAKKVKVDVADLEQFVEESERLRAVLDRALAVEKEEEEEQDEEAAKGKKLKKGAGESERSQAFYREEGPEKGRRG
jgi:hypothetical protein